MRRTIPTILALLALCGLAVAPSAGARSLQRLIAPVAECPGAGDAEAPVAEQESAMRCLTDFARSREGMRPMGNDLALDRSAVDKSADILRCDNFSHFACGRNPMYWMQRVGYIPARCWRIGENIAWGTGQLGSARSIFDAWMHSQGHRENILGPYGQIGVGLRVGGLEGRPEAHVWTQHFGSHCGEQRPGQMHAHIAHAAALTP